MSVKIVEVETKPYRSYMGTSTKSALDIEPENNAVSIVQDECDGYYTSAVWHGYHLYQKFNGHPSEAVIRSFLEGEKAQALLQKILDNYVQEWDGSDWIGYMYSDGDKALAELIEYIESYSDSGYTFREVEEWCHDIEVSKDASEEEIRQFADEIKALADFEHVIIGGSVYQYLLLKKNQD